MSTESKRIKYLISALKYCSDVLARDYKLPIAGGSSVGSDKSDKTRKKVSKKCRRIANSTQNFRDKVKLLISSIS